MGSATELVGREEELELLVRRRSKANTGEGQVVLVSDDSLACHRPTQTFCCVVLSLGSAGADGIRNASQDQVCQPMAPALPVGNFGTFPFRGQLSGKPLPASTFPSVVPLRRIDAFGRIIHHVRELGFAFLFVEAIGRVGGLGDTLVTLAERYQLFQTG